MGKDDCRYSCGEELADIALLYACWAADGVLNWWPHDRDSLVRLLSRVIADAMIEGLNHVSEQDQETAARQRAQAFRQSEN
jgi:hypothetical protein